MRQNRKEFKEKPLWTKVNTTCHGGKVYHGNNERYNRGKKEGADQKSKMKGGQQLHGLDYTPLYGFLRKNVGKLWDEVHSKAIPRLPKDNRFNPFERVVLSHDEWLDLSDEELNKGYFRGGESSYFSQLYVDESGLLKYVNPSLTVNDIPVSCNCCTHSFNGKRIPKIKEF